MRTRTSFCAALPALRLPALRLLTLRLPALRLPALRLPALRLLTLGLVTLGLLALTASAASAAPRRDRADADERGDDDGQDGDRAGRAGREPELPPDAEAVPISGPPVGDVLKAAYRAAGLERDKARSLARRARLAGLAPSVTVRTGRNTSWQDADAEVDRGTTIEARATWRLDRLVFDNRELQAASMQAARGRERRQLASRVIRAYFHWRRTAAAAAGAPRWASRAEEAAAELDALTDGWFTGQLGRARRAPPAKAR